MKRALYFLSALLLIGLFSGCASMSKKECLTADWHAVGYSDGTRGVHYNNLVKHRKACNKYEVVPDEAAYHAGWEQGIRNYCTSDRGYQVGAAGQPYRSICPQDAEENFRDGWDKGVRQYCTADNGLRQGLNGRQYRGVCPTDLEPAFHDFYRLGRDVRKARVEYRGNSQKLSQMEHALAAERDPQRAHNLLGEVERLQHLEERSYTRVIALEACMDSDWYQAGHRDGEAGYPRRAAEVSAGCRNYGISGDRMGYREGWRDGNSRYCTYESGLYIGQSNQTYSGVCSGRNHYHFWQGYEEGRDRYRSERRVRHPRPEKKRVIQQPPVSRDHHKPLRDKVIRHPDNDHDKEIHHPREREVKEHHDNRDKLKRPMPEKSRAADVPGKVKEMHDNRDREMRQPPVHNRAAEPVHKQRVEKAVHDNRDRLKQSMPEKSHKPELKEKKHDDDDDHEKKEKMTRE